MPAYPALTILAMAATVAFDLRVTRSRLVTRPLFWASFGIMCFFQVFVDGWLTRSTSTIVNYDDDETLGIRVFFNSPIEDFGFGFAMILMTLSIWVWAGERRGRDTADTLETG